MTNINLNSEKYDDVSQKYAGKWVIWCDGDVIYADTSFDVVLSKYKELIKSESTHEYAIELIDDGEGAFYGIKF